MFAVVENGHEAGSTAAKDEYWADYLKELVQRIEPADKRIECEELLRMHVEQLQSMGWDDSALTVHKRYLSDLLKKIEEASLLKSCLQQLNIELQLVGSRVYERLFEAAGSEDRKLLTEEQAKNKLFLLLSHLGGKMDEEGMMQLSDPCLFDERLSPHAHFWQTLARTMQSAYPVKELSEPMFHQLRMYIDRQNIHYIRSRFKKSGMTDEQALAAYVQAPGPVGRNGRRIEREPARYHNKLILGEKYSNRVGGNENKKRTVNFHSEFILDSKGNFVSQWNVLEKDEVNNGYHSSLSYYQRRFKENTAYFEEQLMNGESFNYAERNDDRHRRLDVRPPGKLDTPLRKNVGSYGLIGKAEVSEQSEEQAPNIDRKKKWFSPERKNKQRPEMNFDYFSDKGDTYSGGIADRFLDPLRKILQLIKKHIQ